MAALMNLLQAESPRILAVLLDTAVKGFVILAAAGVLAMILRRWTASLRHLVWSLALAAMLCLPVLSAVLPRCQISILPRQAAPLVRAVASHQPAPILDAAPINLTTPYDSVQIPLPEAEADQVTTAPTAARHAHASAQSHSSSGPSLSWQTLAVLVWLAAMFTIGLPLVVGLVSISRRTRQAEPAHRDLAELLDDLCHRSRTRGPIRLLCTRYCEIPATWGALRPVILLPAEAASWPIQRTQAVLLHELAHIRRLDWLTQFMGRIVRILYWFHPLVWLAVRMQRVEAERSCDDAVLAEGLKPSEYARQLLDIVSGIRSTGYSSLAAIAMARRSSLEGRILSILSLRQRRGRLTRPAIAFVMGAMTAVVLPVSIMQATPAKAQVGPDRTTPPGEAPPLPPSVDAEDKPVTVAASGRVTDAHTGRPIAGASVRGWIVVWRFFRMTGLLGPDPESFDRYPYQETTTDADGRYKLKFVTPLTVEGGNKDLLGITVSAGGYETRPLVQCPDVTRKKTNFENIDFGMKIGKRLSGTVVDEDGRPVEGATVDADCNGSGMWDYFGAFGRTNTGPDGRFQLWVTTDKTIGEISWLRIIKPGYGLGYCTHVIGKESLGTIVLPKGGTIHGQVNDAEGHPQADVEVVTSWGNYVVRSTTDKQGRYELKGLPGPEVITRWLKDGNGRTSDPDLGELTVFARDAHGKPLDACPYYQVIAKDGQSIVGASFAMGDNPRVVWPAESGKYEVTGQLMSSGSPFSAAGVGIVPDDSYQKIVRADSQGRFLFPGLSPGKHRLTAAIVPDSGPISPLGKTDTDVQPGKHLNVEIPLEAMALAHVQVIDTEGNPLQGIRIDASGGQSRVTGRTDKDGRATIPLYPNVPQKLSAYAGNGRFFAGDSDPVTPQPKQILENLRIVMAASASIRGQIVSPVSLDGKKLFYMIGEPRNNSRGDTGELELDDAGDFELKTVPPVKTQFHVRVGPGYGDASNLSALVPLDLKPGQQKDLGTITLKPVADTDRGAPPDSWTRYVQEFIAAYRLDSGQQQTAWSILKELKDRAQEYRTSHKAEYDAATKIGDKGRQDRELQVLDGPIDKMFQELKDRLMAIPTEAQRKAVAAGRSLTAPVDTRPTATRKGLSQPDQTTQQTGLSQGDMTREQAAKQLVRQFVQALIDKNYAKAGQLCSGLPAAKVEENFGRVRWIRIVSISEPSVAWHLGSDEPVTFSVPTIVEVERDGQREELQLRGPQVRQVEGDPSRWQIIGGF